MRFRSLLNVALPLVLLCATTSCVYNDHRNFGMTEKWVASDVNHVAKTFTTPILAIGDSIISPATMIWDVTRPGPPYDLRHRYLSYSGSRVIARSDMGLGQQWLAMVPAFLIETAWLIITGPVDIVTVLATRPASDEEWEQWRADGRAADY